MISDGQLYNIAILLGVSAVILIVVYHFLEVNADDSAINAKPAVPVPASGKGKASK